MALAVAQANDKKITIGGQPVTFKMQSEDDQADPDLRWVLAHLVQETARHAGHADILRELLVGSVGR